MLDAFIERRARTIRGNRVLIVLRLFLATLALAVLLLKESTEVALQHPPLYLRPIGLLPIIVCFLTIIYVLVARRTERAESWAPKLAFCQVFVDIALISALIWHTGGVASQFVVLYLICICAAAFVLKWNVALITAATCAILFCFVTVMYSLDVIPLQFREQSPAQVERLRNLGVQEYIQLLLVPVCAFFLTAALAGTLSRRLAAVRLLHHEILDGIGEGIVALDTNRRVLYHNCEFKRLLQAGEPGKHLAINTLLGETLDQQAQEVLSGGQARRIETKHKLPDGRTVPFSVRLIPIEDPDEKKPRALVLALDDITAEKKMEEYLKHKQRLDAMGNISASIAHEIRNPLASIRGAVQEIGRSVEIPEDKKVLLEIVLSESDRLDQIITDFLRYARMRAPNLILTDGNRLLDDVRVLLGPRSDAREVAITVQSEKLRPFAADPEQLRQVFLNLGINALQAMEGCPRRELTISLQPVSLHRANGFPLAEVLERVDRPGLLVEFTDTGRGIGSAALQQIFDPFFTTKVAGTGLGLAIVERIVQAHEGLITVESHEGEGSTFRIWLPSDLKVGLSRSGLRPAIV